VYGKLVPLGLGLALVATIV